MRDSLLGKKLIHGMFKKGIFPLHMPSSHLSRRQLTGRFKARFITIREEKKGKRGRIVGRKKALQTEKVIFLKYIWLVKRMVNIFLVEDEYSLLFC